MNAPAAHTPGPWQVDDALPVTGVAGHTGDMLVIRSRFLGVAYVATEADAALIARAPDLLADNERLRVALELARKQVAYFHVMVADPRFTDRHNDAAMSESALRLIDAALAVSP